MFIDNMAFTCRRRSARAWMWASLLAVALLPSAASAESRRLCDTPMKWSYTKPEPDVPGKYARLLGLWTGAVTFVGSGKSTHMCLAIAIHEVKADGQIGSTFAWHLGDGNELANQVSFGTSTWWGHPVALSAGKPDQLVFGSIAPYRGKWYRYVLDLPTDSDPDTITGLLYGSMQGSAADPSPAAWTGVVEAHQVHAETAKECGAAVRSPGELSDLAAALCLRDSVASCSRSTSSAIRSDRGAR